MGERCLQLSFRRIQHTRDMSRERKEEFLLSQLVSGRPLPSSDMSKRLGIAKTRRGQHGLKGRITSQRMKFQFGRSVEVTREASTIIISQGTCLGPAMRTSGIHATRTVLRIHRTYIVPTSHRTDRESAQPNGLMNTSPKANARQSVEGESQIGQRSILPVEQGRFLRGRRRRATITTTGMCPNPSLSVVEDRLELAIAEIGTRTRSWVLQKSPTVCF